MRTKHVIDKYFNRDFCICIFIVDDAKHVMTFFIKFVDYRANDVVIVNVEQLDNKIHKYVDLTLQKNDQKNE